ncbi:hypothetical protein Slin15195_G029080 [Septoria linicola]|uniref:Uncharacterized protein n=1 Tax=Septoria linicola TaxID=215465 RepID=A0A9Q9EH42_9PEZI|nr:hypothetical protein Slin14017_G028110 [Septoria linicola]USW49589.1 hypothetical protein Slin15195_G029080 [Septoria linicola]
MVVGIADMASPGNAGDEHGRHLAMDLVYGNGKVSKVFARPVYAKGLQEA